MCEKEIKIVNITLFAAGVSFDRDASSFCGSAHGNRCSWTLANLYDIEEVCVLELEGF